MDNKNKKTLIVVVVMFLAVIMIIVGLAVFFKNSETNNKVNNNLSCTIKNSDGYKVTVETKFEDGKVSSVEMIYVPKEGELIYDGKSKTAQQALDYMTLQGTTYTSIDDELHIFLENRAYTANKNNTAVTNMFLGYDKLKVYYEKAGYTCASSE